MSLLPVAHMLKIILNPNPKQHLPAIGLYLRKPQSNLNQINPAAVYKHTNLYIILKLIPICKAFISFYLNNYMQPGGFK